MWNFSKVASFLRQQSLYLSVAALGTAVFWAVGQRVNPATVILYVLLLSNLAAPLLDWVRRKVAGQPFPLNWLVFVTALVALTPVIYIVASAIVIVVAPPSPQSLEHLLRTGWKFPCLVLFVYGLASFLYSHTQERLKRRNMELEKSLRLRTAQLQLQVEDLQRAQEIQQSLLPKEIPQITGFELAASWQPARLVGGDYYDVLRLDENRLGICIADVVGKGVSAALLMANVQATVRAFAFNSESPARLCSRVNSVLCGNIDIGKFVTFFYGVLDGRERTLQYCNAGHPRPILVSWSATQQLVEGGGAVLGVFPEWKYEDAVVRLNAGDRLLLFTDGITEAAAPDGQEFGDKNVAAEAKANLGSCAAELNRIVLARVKQFCAEQFSDDATLLVVAAN